MISSGLTTYHKVVGGGQLLSFLFLSKTSGAGFRLVTARFLVSYQRTSGEHKPNYLEGPRIPPFLLCGESGAKHWVRSLHPITERQTWLQSSVLQSYSPTWLLTVLLLPVLFVTGTVNQHFLYILTKTRYNVVTYRGIKCPVNCL